MAVHAHFGASASGRRHATPRPAPRTSGLQRSPRSGPAIQRATPAGRSRCIDARRRPARSMSRGRIRSASHRQPRRAHAGSGPPRRAPAMPRRWDSRGRLAVRPSVEARLAPLPAVVPRVVTRRPPFLDVVAAAAAEIVPVVEVVAASAAGRSCSADRLSGHRSRSGRGRHRHPWRADELDSRASGRAAMRGTERSGSRDATRSSCRGCGRRRSSSGPPAGLVPCRIGRQQLRLAGEPASPGVAVELATVLAASAAATAAGLGVADRLDAHDAVRAAAEQLAAARAPGLCAVALADHESTATNACSAQSEQIGAGPSSGPT